MHSGKSCHPGAEEMLDAACHLLSNVLSALPPSSPFPEGFPAESTPSHTHHLSQHCFLSCLISLLTSFIPLFSKMVVVLALCSVLCMHCLILCWGHSGGWRNVMFRKGIRIVQHLATMQENFLWIIPFITLIKYTTILIALAVRKSQ